MATPDTITEAKSKSGEIAEVVSRLKKKTVELPAWAELVKEYDPKLHPVMDKAIYQDKPGKNGKNIKVTRVTRGLQRRSVNIMTGMMFGIPVKRVYTHANKHEENAAKILEKIYEANHIDTTNIDRAAKLFASCELATLWYAIREDNTLYGEKGLLKIKHLDFSPMTEDSIYPLFDEYRDMIALSFEYTRKEEGEMVTYFDSYTSTNHIKYRCAKNEWEVVENEALESISKIPAVYINRPTPIWEESNNVTEIEWAYSRNGNYLRRNSVPIYEVCDDEKIKFGNESDDDERVVIQLSAAGKSGYKTWPQAVESLKFQVQSLEDAFFTDIQLPNYSGMENNSGTASGESKKYRQMDSLIKVITERGRWLEMFSRETKVIIAFAKAAFPAYAEAFDKITIEHVITPFTITDEKDKIGNIATALGAKVISRETGVGQLGWVQDVQAELKRIEADETADFTQPTE